jgi:hypothetical protein
VTRSFIAVLKQLLAFTLLAAPALAQGSIAGVVSGNDARPIESATVRAERADKSVARDAVTDERGAFRLTGLAAGSYTVTVHRVGYRNAELFGVRVVDAQTRTLSVTLAQAPTQLSTIQVVTSPTSVNAGTPEFATRLDRAATQLLPSARDAASLIALVPGARKDQLWGGTPGVSNNYQLDGVAMNHPGIGGDLLAPSIDWIDALDVRGLGAGAQFGNFQGGVINAITKTGSNERRNAIRTNYESASLSASNFNADEQGVEQAGRRELAGEALGPFVRDRLFYFVGGQYVSRSMRSPDLTTPAGGDFQLVHEEQADARAIAKLTWLPGLGQRVDLLGGFAGRSIDHAGINGADSASATHRVTNPTTYFGLSWSSEGDARNQFAVRLAGYSSRETRDGYEGFAVPSVQPVESGRQPSVQNSAFSELREPSSFSATAEWRATRHLFTEHQLVFGGEVGSGRWQEERLRNGGLTWRPYNTGGSFNATDATTWGTVASEWGGEIRLNSDVANRAAYVQDQFEIGSRVTVTPGIRYGHWSGWLRPSCATATSCYRFEAVRAEGWDPRIGASWDVTGRNTLALKAHWGRYHQGMYSLFFDRAEGADVYTNHRFYYTAPVVTDSRATFTPVQRDAPGSQFLTFGYVESIRNATGRVDGYKQPYVDQAVFAVEKSFGASWKLEALYTKRVNGDIVGLVDKNIATNYTPLRNLKVDNRYVSNIVLDAHYQPLVLPNVYVANSDLQAYLGDLAFRRQFPAQIFGYDTAYINALTWNPDIRLTTVPQARRAYDQVTLSLRTVQPRWRAEGSLTGAQLKGNLPGATGHGTTGTQFTAGPFVNPNEAINSYGYLSDALELEAKVFVSGNLWRSWSGGVLYTHTLGERFAPSFTMEGRYVMKDSTGAVIPNQLLTHTFGQSILVEPRGDRRYADRAVVDAHLEWRSKRRAVLTLDLFNVLGEDEIVQAKTTLEDQVKSVPTTLFGAARLRVTPRRLRIGIRVE